jgi:pyruvate dehydrogenase (quinone)
MSKTVGDFLVQRLQDWGVRHLFGYPGDGINGMFGALNRAGGKIDFIQARHEEMAAFMASAMPKFSGRRLHRNLRTRRLASDHRAL